MGRSGRPPRFDLLQAGSNKAGEEILIGNGEAEQNEAGKGVGKVDTEEFYLGHAANDGVKVDRNEVEKIVEQPIKKKRNKRGRSVKDHAKNLDNIEQGSGHVARLKVGCAKSVEN